MNVSGRHFAVTDQRQKPRLSLNRRTLLCATMIAAGLPISAGAADASAAVVPIQQLCNQLIAIMHAGQSAPFNQRFGQLAPTIDSVFDLAEILQVSVGPTWAGLPPEQKALLEGAFRRYTIASYVNSFDEYSGQRFDVAPQTRVLPNQDQVVDTRLVTHSGDVHVLDYVMRQTPQGWRAIDVLLDGTISRVAVQRSDFRSLLRQGGAAALAKSLQEKTANLSGGAA